MDPNKTTLERTFELAQSGKYANTSDIKRQLQSEGYDPKIISGPALLKQLRQIIVDASGK